MHATLPRLLSRPWTADEKLNLVLQKFILSQGCVASRIQHCEQLQEVFKKMNAKSLIKQSRAVRPGSQPVRREAPVRLIQPALRARHIIPGWHPHYCCMAASQPSKRARRPCSSRFPGPPDRGRRALGRHVRRWRGRGRQAAPSL